MKKRAEENQEWPVKNVDYYVLRVDGGRPIPGGWLVHTWTNQSLSGIKAYLREYLSGRRSVTMEVQTRPERRWALYPGPRPDKKWGPVSP